MDDVKPVDVVSAMIETSRDSLQHSPRHLLIRGAIAGGILGSATRVAISGALSTAQPLVGAAIFPVGLTMIVLLGRELVNGSFGLLPLALGHLVGGFVFTGLGLYLALGSARRAAPASPPAVHVAAE